MPPNYHQHERERWAYMDYQALSHRLTKITVRGKLQAFIEMAAMASDPMTIFQERIPNVSTHQARQLLEQAATQASSLGFRDLSESAAHYTRHARSVRPTGTARPSISPSRPPSPTVEQARQTQRDEEQRDAMNRWLNQRREYREIESAIHDSRRSEVEMECILVYLRDIVQSLADRFRATNSNVSQIEAYTLLEILRDVCLWGGFGGLWQRAADIVRQEQIIFSRLTRLSEEEEKKKKKKKKYQPSPHRVVRFRPKKS